MPTAPGVVVTDFSAETVDSWRINLRRYCVPEAPQSGARVPVILCHGLACCGRFWDLTADRSFARHLAESGYDVWVPSLRGSGPSSKPPLYVMRELFQRRLPSLERLRGGRDPRPRDFNWNFDDHVLRDLPAIIDLVKAETGSNDVAWVGHSMGAMAMYGYLERCGRRDVAAFVSIAGPIYMPPPAEWSSKVALRCRAVARFGRALLNTQFFSGIGAITAHVPYEALRSNRGNMNSRVLRAFYRDVNQDVSPGLFNQFLEFAVNGNMVSVDGAFDYTAEIGRLKVPLLCIAGRADRLCVPAALRYAYERVGSKDKSYVELARSSGFSADYGHVDMVLGNRSREEVLPLIVDFLATRATPACSASSR